MRILDLESCILDISCRKLSLAADADFKTMIFLDYFSIACYCCTFFANSNFFSSYLGIAAREPSATFDHESLDMSPVSGRNSWKFPRVLSTV